MMNLQQALTDLEKEEKDLVLLKKNSSVLNKEIVTKKKRISRLKQIITDLNTNQDIVITDHAIIRYLERVRNIDIDFIRDEIINDEKIREAIKTLGSGTFPLQGYKLKVKNKVVTTVITDEKTNTK